MFISCHLAQLEVNHRMKNQALRFINQDYAFTNISQGKIEILFIAEIGEVGIMHNYH